MLFVISVALNYTWELAQAPLFVGMESFAAMWWHCFVASLGDGIILLFLHGLGWATFKRWNWSFKPGIRQITFMLITSLGIAILIEWLAVHGLHRWAYADHMPRIPMLDVGMTPILQMLILPPLIFFLTHKFLPPNKVDTL
jgi:hypothetical protein